MAKKLLLMVAAVFMLSSCALLGIHTEAESEFERGLALFNQGRYEEAIPRFQRATLIDPNFSTAYLYLGRSFISLMRWRDAIPPLRTAFRLSPDETKKEALNFLFDALFAAALNDFRLGNFSSSVSHLREVLELDPKSARGRNEIAKSLIGQGGNSLSKGDVSQAIAAYTEAAKLSPNSFDALFGLARAFFRNGETQKALRAVQDAININPNSREAETLFRDLQRR